MKTLIIIPTYNELDNLPKLLPEVLSKSTEINVLIVDDNSPDGTAAFVENEMKNTDRIHLIKRSSKQGLLISLMIQKKSRGSWMKLKIQIL
jgi:dolichol-phosphate mannosyltransferase